MLSKNPQLQIGQQVEMRKKHPCGSVHWTIYRIGADIGIQCLGCERRVMLSRPHFMKRFKKIVHTETES